MALSRLLVVLMVAAASPAAAATAPSFVLTAWTEETGLPAGEILDMTQDLEGYLWLGTSDGLVRFDGARFIVWDQAGATPLPRAAVPAVVATRDGSLWVGYTNGSGVSRIRGAEVVTFGREQGVPEGPVAALLQDSAGAVWVGTRGGLARYRNDRWETLQAGGEVFSLFEDRGGGVWVGTAAGVFLLRRTGTDLELKFPHAQYVQHFAQDASGTMWVTDLQDIVRRLASNEPPAHAADVRLPQSGWRVVDDRAGRIWVAALGGGLLRMSEAMPPSIERVPYEHVIAGAPRSLFHDRDGDIWIGMRPSGLLRLSESVVQADVALEGVTNDGVRAIAALDDGSVWIGTGHNLLRFGAAGRDVYGVTQTRVLHSDARGAMWAVTSNGIQRIEHGRLVPTAVPPGVRWDRITSMASDPSGTLWLCSSNQGVLAWRDGTLAPFAGLPPEAGTACSYAYADRMGRVWFGFANGRLVAHGRGATLSYGPADGLASGGVLVIAEDRAGALWVATRNGVSRQQGEQFLSITSANGPFKDIVAALVEDRQGFFWVSVHSGAGVVRFDPKEVEKLSVDPARPIEYRLFDTTDGMRGELRPLIRPAGVRAADGRLWFASGLGVVIFDPLMLPPVQRPNPPRIEAVRVNGRRVAVADEATLENGIAALAVDYTTASIGAASKLRFRHRLEGLDADWVAAGADRTASYENLPSGRYRFHVSATADGVWTEAATWAFTVPPPFYQRRSFVLLAGLAALAAVGAAWWLRVGALRARYALVFEERARVSREVHDTLLQSLAAIGFELETIAAQLDASQRPALDSLRRLRRQVGHSVRDARDSIWGLRRNRMESQGLVDALRELAENTREASHVQVEVIAGGRPARYPAETELQLLRISQEAVRNAVRHGGAMHIHIVLDYRPDSLLVSVSDNGRGFVVEDDRAAARMGEHLGLLSMRERAERIGGRFTITSSPGKGAVVEVQAPLDQG